MVQMLILATISIDEYSNTWPEPVDRKLIIWSEPVVDKDTAHLSQTHERYRVHRQDKDGTLRNIVITLSSFNASTMLIIMHPLS